MAFLAGVTGCLVTSTAPASAPEARWGPVFVYDPVRAVVLLFGGASQPRTARDDTWTWDGESWRQHRVPGPSARAFSAAAFHEGRGTVIVHGGRDTEGATLSDTWEWDGSTWRELESNGPWARDHHHMVYVPDESRLLAFGGWDGDDVTGATWAWDGRWQHVTDDGPPQRAAFAMAYDRARRRVVVSGGLWISGQYADVWEWNGQSWTAVAGPYDNSSLDHHTMVYDAARRQLVVFGGKDYRYQARDATLTLRDGRLVPHAQDGPGATLPGPSPRHSVGMTYDSARQHVTLFGGKALNGREQIPLGDLWEWTDAGWTPRAAAPSAEGNAATSEIGADVRSAFEKFTQAFRDGDVDVLERMITSRYVHCNNGSPVIGRDAWLAYNRSRRRGLHAGDLVVETYEVGELAIDVVTPEAAVVTGVVLDRGQRDGEPYETRVRFTQTWVLQDGRWKRAAFHDSRQ